MIHVLAIITTQPGQRDTVLAAFRANMPAVHAEKGCIEYGPAVDADGLGGFQTKVGPDTFVVIDKWDSVDALKAHAAAPHMAAYAAKTKPMIARRPVRLPGQSQGTENQPQHPQRRRRTRGPATAGKSSATGHGSCQRHHSNRTAPGPTVAVRRPRGRARAE